MAYRPIIKEKGFLPNPVAKYGIPGYADSSVDKAVTKTVAYEQWWDEQFEYCINGYTTGGIYIPGRFYYYLNFNYISTVARGYHHPDYIDADLEFFLLVEEAKKTSKGLITVKARRRGMSEKWAKAIAGYGTRFTAEGYRSAIVAGLSDYSEGLRDKFLDVNSMVPPEFYLHSYKNDQELWIAGYYVRNQFDDLERGGSNNRLAIRTANKNANVLKGNYFDDVAFEEAGEFDLLIPTYGATKDSLMDLGIMKGTTYVFGTGGNISTQSKGFLQMWSEAEKYGLLKYELFGPRLRKPCYIGCTNSKGDVEEDVPNILKMAKELGLSYDQILGCEDTDRAFVLNMERRKELYDSKDRKLYYDEIQNNPNDQKEAFLKFGANPFDIELLTSRATTLSSMTFYPYRRYGLEYVMDSNGKQLDPVEVRAVELDHDEKHDFEVWINPDGMPIKNVKNIDIMGVDSYDVDQALSSKSQGGALIFRRNNGIKGVMKNKFVAAIRKRPRRREMFYETCLRLSIFYNTIGNCLMDYAKNAIFDWYKRNGGKRYLAPRPRSFEAEDSKQTHDYGVLLTVRSKPSMIGLLQSYVLDYGDTIDFPVLLQELINYDVEAKESDWDLADAAGIALMRDKDMRLSPLDISKDSIDPFETNRGMAGFDAEGNAIYEYGYSSAGVHHSEYTDETMKLLVQQGLW